MASTAEIQDFLDSYGGAVVRSCIGTSLFPSVVLAQAALETGWGKTVKKAANNLFGIKATAKWTGRVISLNTSEYVNGVKQSYSGTGKTYSSYSAAVADGADKTTLFRAYVSFGESINDHNRLITESARYQRVTNATTPEEQCDALQACGYSTSPAYAGSLKSIIRNYGLEKYDRKKKASVIAIAASLTAAAITLAVITYKLMQ